MNFQFSSEEQLRGFLMKRFTEKGDMLTYKSWLNELFERGNIVIVNGKHYNVGECLDLVLAERIKG